MAGGRSVTRASSRAVPRRLSAAVLVSPGGRAQRQMARLVALFVGSGLLFYLLVGWGDAVDQARHSAWWFTPFVVGSLVTGAAVLLAGAATSRHRLVRAGAWIVVVAVPLHHLLWTVSWDGYLFPTVVDLPWMLDFVGLAPMAGVLLLRGRILLVYHLVLTSAVQLIPLPYRPSLGTEDVLLWTTLSVVFAGVFVLGTYSLYRSAVRADAEAERAEELAAESAGTTAMALERERLDALIHDDVLGTLLAVTRTGDSRSVAGLARRAIDRLDGTGAGGADEPLSVTAFVGLLRSAVGTVDSTLELEVEGPVDGVTATSSVASDLAAASMEAVRNAVLHSGDPEGPRVRLDLVPVSARQDPDRTGPESRSTVPPADTGIRIRILDRGRGFDLRGVRQTRLGVRGSILGRVNALAGGRAEVRTRPGEGTTVLVEWTP